MGSGLGAAPLNTVGRDVFRVKELSAGVLRPNPGGTTDSYCSPRADGSGCFSMQNHRKIGRMPSVAARP